MLSRFVTGFGYWGKEEQEETATSAEASTVAGGTEGGDVDLATADGDLFQYHYTRDPKFYIKLRDIKLKIRKIADPDDPYVFMLVIENDKGEAVLGQIIHNTMQLEIYPETDSVVWTMTEGGVVSQWSVVFHKRDEEEKCTQILAQCMYETSTGLPFTKLPAEDQPFFAGQFNTKTKTTESDDLMEEDLLDFARLKLDDSEVAELVDNTELPGDRTKVAGSSSSSPTSTTAAEPAAQFPGADADGNFNSLLCDSSRHKKCFVIRGDNVGVFNRDDDCVFDTQITNLVTPAGTTLKPTKIMLHNSDNTLLALSDVCPTKMFPIDLEVGKVVEEWQANDYDTVQLRHMAPSTKYGGLLGENTLAVMGHNVCVGFDPRKSGAVKAISDPANFIYQKDPMFTCCATTRQGHLVIGNAKGEIRLYSGIPGMPNPASKTGRDAPKTAKTSLPGAGDPITALDVTADGKWILATTKTYLVVVSTEMPDCDDLGYVARMGSKKPHPLRLQLLSADLAKMGGPANVNFTAAKFNTGVGEQWIVTSTGPYVVTWNFRFVKLGDTKKYIIKKTHSEIMSDQFCAVGVDEDGTRAPIVVAHRNDVRIEKRTQQTVTPYTKTAMDAFDRQ
eukprot:TRINITY_DN66844_c7_g2_i1.p1 TRINITY_DN66844_c7_g2~~TRINITY_DN66844_c7_g2_i1.p1  ORF type:complete len:617 (+),score=94.86 TRINITY_DN66844_c7_g2_i1:47-1897(+)